MTTSARAGSNFQSKRKAAAATLFFGAVALSTVAIAFQSPARAQETTAHMERPMAETDDAALAAFGLEATAIKTSDDPERLWRAVRELVLTGRVSDEMQRRLLRRVWTIDPDIANGSGLASASH
jgi:hypothetical protein